MKSSKSIGKKLSSAPKTPPAPAKSRAEIDEWIASRMPGLQPMLKRLDALIRTTIPGVQYAIKWNRAHYGLPKTGWMFELVPYDVSVNVVFFGGADFDSPPPLGSRDRARYVKLITIDEATSPEMRAWLKQAARTPGWK